ncbi:hypothetical protein EYZ11_000349 [Aspergillus tanneri]|uniref:Uncharacterized protein n=1 Tax=Aspergillus tanneri TaxID=1220188 RepID=A0A4S3JXH8_9EURO|nr:hypothetical protein EYZ11_000349 [Aspergillus tanneri]
MSATVEVRERLFKWFAALRRNEV